MTEFSNDQIIRALYLSILDREPDAGGFEDHDARLRAGATLQDLIAAFINSEEFKKRYLAAHPIEEASVDYSAIGMKDAIRNGWYAAQSTELCRGFAINSSDTVADIGCGDGGNIVFCARYASKVIAVDLDPRRLANTERRLQKDSKAQYVVHLSDGNPLPIDTGTIDKVICTEVLEHVDDPVRFIDELVRIGKPGAMYLLTVPDALCEQVLKQIAHPAAYQKPHHVRIFSRQEFESLAQAGGLQVIDHRYRSFYWAVWHALNWRCGAGMTGHHPVLDYWAKAWAGLLELPRGEECARALDRAMPKSQIIIARKTQ